MSDSNDSGASGPNEKRKKVLSGDTSPRRAMSLSVPLRMAAPSAKSRRFSSSAVRPDGSLHQ